MVMYPNISCLSFDRLHDNTQILHILQVHVDFAPFSPLFEIFLTCTYLDKSSLNTEGECYSHYLFVCLFIHYLFMDLFNFSF